MSCLQSKNATFVLALSLATMTLDGAGAAGFLQRAVGPSDDVLELLPYRLHFRIWPGTEPWIIFESGGGAAANQWDAVAMQIAQQTRSGVITYDRAGFGESDLPGTPYDIQAEVEALWAGLHRLISSDSVVLVGHSYGAFLTELFAARHPKAVKGILFVEPNTIAFIDALGGPAALKQDPMSQPPYDRSRPERLTKDQRAELRVFDGIDQTAAIMRSVARPDSIPVRVITAGRLWWPIAHRNQVWRAAHERLAASATDGRLIVAERSGHRVDLDQPDIIVNTVSDLIEQARRR